MNFPALILTPAFSFWIIGPYGALHRTSNQIDSTKKFVVSYFHSWINVALTVGGSIITWSVVGNINKKNENDELDVNQLLISLPLLAFSMLLFFLIALYDVNTLKKNYFQMYQQHAARCHLNNYDLRSSIFCFQVSSQQTQKH